MFSNLKRIATRRGWRAFIGEVGIIVLGVLIAVGIGKVVEALDWRDKVAASQRALEQDVRESAFYLTERVRSTPCLDRQLDRLEKALLTGTRVPRHRIMTSNRWLYATVYVHPSRSWSVLQWTSTVADNVPAHMETSDRDFYRDHYLQLATLNSLNSDENGETADLDLLNSPTALDPRTRNDLLRIVARERQRTNLMYGVATYVLRGIRDSGRQFKITAGDWAQMNTVNWCRANGLL